MTKKQKPYSCLRGAIRNVHPVPPTLAVRAHECAVPELIRQMAPRVLFPTEPTPRDIMPGTDEPSNTLFQHISPSCQGKGRKVQEQLSEYLSALDTRPPWQPRLGAQGRRHLGSRGAHGCEGGLLWPGRGSTMVLDRGCGEARPASADVPGGREINVGEERSLERSQYHDSGKRVPWR